MSNTTTMLSQKRLFRNNVAFLLTVAAFLTPYATYATSTESNAISQPEVPGAKIESFEYQLENRPDPFVPFITEKAASSDVDMNEIIRSGAPLTGMQLFEPGQLNLVALMQMGSEDIAMVEDFTGKGYVLTEGTKIGEFGVVKDIKPNTVIIEETRENRAHKKTVTEVVMILKKEGDE